MAISNINGKFKGSVGNLTYRIVNGRSIVQSKPGKGNVKQTPPTKVSAIEFSLASNRAKILRTILYPMIQGKQDSGMINRLTVATAKVIRSNSVLAPGARDLADGNLAVLDNFEFNSLAPFVKLFKPQLTLEQTEDGYLKIAMPAFQGSAMLNFPDTATGLTLKIFLAAVDLKTNQYCYCKSESLFIPRGNRPVPAAEWYFPDNLHPDCLYLACCALEYSRAGVEERILLNHAKLQPVLLLGLRASLGVGQHLAPPVHSQDIWNSWLEIPGLDGRQLRKA
jgi:hypothetical protein